MSDQMYEDNTTWLLALATISIWVVTVSQSWPDGWPEDLRVGIIFISTMMIIGFVMEFFSYRKYKRKQRKFLKHVVRYGTPEEVADYQNFLSKDPGELEIEIEQAHIVSARRQQKEYQRLWEEKRRREP